ncbi:MAG TPA: hypothetical protein VIO11_05525, partial [Candidatus Methanoperedens sp.]
MLREVYERTNATEVTNNSPGAGKGILEILKNPWNESKVLLLVEGSDEWGVRAGSVVLDEKQKIKDKTKVPVDWEQDTGVQFPIDNAEEAIRYANTDARVKKFIDKESARGHKVGISAKFLGTTNYTYAEFLNTTDNWIVSYQAPAETVMNVYISPNGNIIFGGVAR